MPNNHRSQLEEDIRKCKCLPRVSDLDQKSKHQETTNQKAPPCQNHYILSRKLPEITRCLCPHIQLGYPTDGAHQGPLVSSKVFHLHLHHLMFYGRLGQFLLALVTHELPTFICNCTQAYLPSYSTFCETKKGHRFCFNAHTHISSHVSLSSCNTNSVSDIRFFQLPTNDHDFGSSVYTHPHQVHS